jgi:hypothetical protein
VSSALLHIFFKWLQKFHWQQKVPMAKNLIIKLF